MMRRVLITGCSSGFGHDLVSHYLRQGWFVVATLRDLANRKNLFIDLQTKFPDQLTVLEMDVTVAADRERLVRYFESQNGGLDCLVNNAGFGLFGALEDLSETEIRAQFETNFFGALFLTRICLPLLRKSKGRVIVVSSVVGYIGLPLGSLYSASKFALEGLFESLRLELKPFEVQVSLVEPGQFRTSFSKKMKYGETSASPFSPYFRMTKAFRKFRERRSSQRGIAPFPVIERIVDLSEASRMPLRVRCGVDAQVGYWMKWLLPSSLFESLMSFVFGRVLFKSEQ